MGAKLFAWIGGLALFLGVAFFVKYSFEHNLIPPELTGCDGLSLAWVFLLASALKRKENAVTAQTLVRDWHPCALCGDVCLPIYYHFSCFGLIRPSL